jgi:2-dehydro-3-deoxygalactonokinase
VKHLIAVDWGTSSLRGALLDRDGTVLEEIAAPAGILGVPAGGFPSVFAQHFGKWQQATGALALIAGMAGSRQGWQEAPYCACPAGFVDIASRLHWIERERIALVPGLSCEDDGTPDVMRGEETQVFGALDLLGLDDARVVLPGTHSKWVDVEQRRIVRFRTFMTGEMYSLLRHHSILTRTLPENDGELDPASFRRGLTRAAASASLLHAAFSVRTLALFDRLPAASMPSYLSGLVIGDELRAQDLGNSQDSIVVIGAPALTARYQLALESLGIAAVTVGAAASWRGLWAIARQLEQMP